MSSKTTVGCRECGASFAGLDIDALPPICLECGHPANYVVGTAVVDGATPADPPAEAL